MPLWVEEVNNRLQVHTPRVTDSPLFSPCAREAPRDTARGPADAGGASSAVPVPVADPPPAPSCEARSAASDEPASVPVLHDLEQHFCSAFLDDDFVPGKEAAAPVNRRTLPAGILANEGVGAGVGAGVAGDGTIAWAGRGPRPLGPVVQQDSNLETGLSFFGPATVHSHFPEELGNAVEVHHYVVAAGTRGAGGAFGSLAQLRQALHTTLLCGTPAATGSVR